MDKLKSLKETDLSSYCVPLTGVQINLLSFILKSIVDETLIVDRKKYVNIETPPESHYRMLAWSLLHYFNCIRLMDFSDDVSNA